MYLPTITVDPHKLFLAAAVVQATFGLTLALLAWTDRRTHGMFWLAASAGLEFFSTTFRLWRGFNEFARWDVPGAALLLATVLLMYRGLRWFAVRRELESQRWPLILTITALTGILLGFSTPVYGLILLRGAIVVTLGVICRMLWDARIVELRSITRVTAVLCGMMMVILCSRFFVTASSATVNRPTFSLFGRELVLILLTLLEFSFVALFVAETNRRLHEETRIDALTGLRNRRSIEETAATAITSATRTGKSLSLLMLDLDHFKLLNDTWGHALGDLALRAVGGVLHGAIQSKQYVARLGGEEFAVLLPGLDMQTAGVVAEQLRAAIEALSLNANGEAATLTVSIGVSTLAYGEYEWDPMLQRADVALYRAKTDGRNRIHMSTYAAPEPHRALEPRAGFWARLFSGRGPVL